MWQGKCINRKKLNVKTSFIPYTKRWHQICYLKIELTGHKGMTNEKDYRNIILEMYIIHLIQGLFNKISPNAMHFLGHWLIESCLQRAVFFYKFLESLWSLSWVFSEIDNFQKEHYCKESKKQQTLFLSKIENFLSRINDC